MVETSDQQGEARGPQGPGSTAHKELAFRYLNKLLPDARDAEVAEALQKTDKQGVPATVADVGTLLGTQFYRVRAPIEDLLAHGSTLPALEVCEPPRVLLGARGEWVSFLEGSRTIRYRRSELSGELREFIVPSPRMTLAALRGRSRVKRVLAYLSTETSLIKALIVYAIFVEILSLGAPLAVQVLINTIGFGMMTQQLIVLASVLLLTLTAAAGLQIFQQVLVEHLSRRFFARTVMDYSERLPLVKAGAMKHPIHRFFEVASVDKAFFVLGLDLIALALQLIAATLLLAFYHPALLSFTVIMAVSAALVVRLPFSAALSRSLEESKGKYELADFLLSQKANELERVAHFSRWEDSRKGGFRITLGQQAGLLAINVVLSVALLFVGGMLVIEGQLTLGQLVAAELVAGTALLSLSKLGKQLPKIYDLVTSFEKLGGFVDLPFEAGPTGFTAPPIPASLLPRKEAG